MSIKITDNQKRAIYHTQGPLIISAGPGSGKTFVVVEKILYLINEKKTNPQKILATSFTNKSADEIRQRLNMKNMPLVSTFHSLAFNILKKEKINFKIANNKKIQAIFKNILKKFPEIKINQAKLIINNYKAGEKTLKNQEKRLYQLYQNALSENGLLDFDDLILNCLDLFQKNPEILEKWQNNFEYIICDEFQDANKTQANLINLLAKKHKNICVVGDVNQAIYSFRGTSPKNLLFFKEKYPQTEIVDLNENFRSTKNIVQTTNYLIGHNQEKLSKKISTNNPEGEKIEAIKTHTSWQEADFIAEKIEEIIGGTSSATIHTQDIGREKIKFNFDDIAIIFRTNSLGKFLETALLKKNIPCNLVGADNFFEKPEINQIIALLSTFDEEDNQEAWEIVLKNFVKNLDKKILLNIINSPLPLITLEKTAETEIKVAEFLKKYKKIDLNLNLREQIKNIYEIFNLKEKYLDGTEKNAKKYNNLRQLLNITISYENLEAKTARQELIKNAQISTKEDLYEIKEKSVTLLTAHSAKGLEFPIVFVVGAEEDLFPCLKNNENNLEEERRIFYVAISRAKEKLYITYTDKRQLFGKDFYPLTSRFLKELPAENIENKELIKKKRKHEDQASLFNF